MAYLVPECVQFSTMLQAIAKCTIHIAEQQEAVTYMYLEVFVTGLSLLIGLDCLIFPF